MTEDNSQTGNTKLKYKRTSSTVSVSRVRKKPEQQQPDKAKNKRNFGLEFEQPKIPEKSKFHINLIFLAILVFALIAKSRGLF
jgi:hypothetical protein